MTIRELARKARKRIGFMSETVALVGAGFLIFLGYTAINGIEIILRGKEGALGFVALSSGEGWAILAVGLATLVGLGTGYTLNIPRMIRSVKFKIQRKKGTDKRNYILKTGAFVVLCIGLIVWDML